MKETQYLETLARELPNYKIIMQKNNLQSGQNFKSTLNQTQSDT